MTNEKLASFDAMVRNVYGFPEDLVPLNILVMYRQHFWGGDPELLRAAKEVVSKHRADLLSDLEEEW